jgi:predicted solute-binding protein
MCKFVYSNDLIIQPLVFGIENRLVPYQFSIEKLSENEAFQLLENGDAQLGIISPLEYAKSKGNMRILEDFSITSASGARNALLFFRGNLKHITHISTTCELKKNFDAFLGDIVLNEVFDVQAEWKIIHNNLEIQDFFKKYEIFFFAGGAAFEMYGEYENYIDLSEEWILKMNLPLVHRIVVVYESFNDQKALESLQLSREMGVRNLVKIAKTYANYHKHNWNLYYNLLNNNYYYYSDTLSWQSMENLLQYIFFYGRTDYYPELKFYNNKVF